MSRGAVTRIVALGALTGVRSMAGVSTLAFSRGGAARVAMVVAAAGEMIADKTPFIGNRTDALPLAGRAVMGAVVGALAAREHDEPALLGSVLGAAVAVAAAHLAYHARTRLAPAGAAGGLLEDALVVAIATRYA